MRRSLPFLTPLVLLFVTMLLAGLCAIAVFITQNAHAILSEQEQQVYALVLNDVVTKLEREISSHAVWQPSKRAQSIINHHFSQLAPIKRISVFDMQGKVLLDTNPLFLGARVSALWLQNSANPSQRIWQDDSPGLRAADAILRNPAGQPVAYLVVLTEALAERDTASRLIFSIDWQTWLFLLLLLATAFWLAFRMSRQMHQQVQPVLDDLAHCAELDAKLPSSELAAFTTPVAQWLRYLAAAQQKLRSKVEAP